MTEYEQLRRYVALCRETGEFELTSGDKSDTYFDLKQLLLYPESCTIAGKQMVRLVKQVNYAAECVVGTGLGGDMLVAATVISSNMAGLDLCGLFVRGPRDHGTGAKIEGMRAFEPGDQAVVVEDVVTTGKTVLHVVEAVREAGLDCRHAVTILDREEGGSEFLKEHGVELTPLFKVSDIPT